MCNDRLSLQERDMTQQQANELADALEASQSDTVTLSQALDAAQAALDERAAAYESQLASMQETVSQAEDAIKNTNRALMTAQV